MSIVLSIHIQIRKIKQYKNPYQRRKINYDHTEDPRFLFKRKNTANKQHHKFPNILNVVGMSLKN